ncbi:MAG: hypothetical protein ACXADA_04605 [Candidatus Hodarchaeales archaeon]
MVSITEFFNANFTIIFNYVVAIIFLLVLIALYIYAGHRGFLVITIGQLFKLFWQSFYLFVLQGSLWIQLFIDQGSSMAEIAMVSTTLSLFAFVFHFLEISLFIIGLILLASDLARTKYSRRNIQEMT